jgi:hypothetical protein
MSERGGKAGVLERVRRLIALASSSNENEARTAAILAARLIRRHRLVISLPPATPGQKGKKASSRRGVRQVADVPERIVSPLGGECTVCGARYRGGQHVYWFASGGGMHEACFEKWRRNR